MWNLPATQRVTGRIGAYLSPPKLSNILLGLIIFFSATQLGFHFWPSSSLVYGIRIDYLAPTIYFLDPLIIAYLGLQFRSLRDSRQVITTFVPLLLTSLIYSQNPLATLSWSLHFLLYLSFAASLFHQFRSLRDSRREITTLRFALTLALFFQSLLALAQVLLGRSVGGFMYYLGERSVAVGSPNIALATIMDSVVLRAYGTFGHPNVLAGWAVITLLVLLHLRGPSSQARLSFSKGSDPLRRSWLSTNLHIPYSLFPVLFTTLILILTQSRAAALSLFAIIIPFYLIKNLKIRLMYFLIPILLIPILLVPLRSALSLSERLELQDVSLSIITAYPLFGTGAGASLSTYPIVSPATRLLQPDHNSFTLFLSWFGVIGVLALINFIRVYGHTNLRIYSFFPLLPLLLLDHYFLTSPQGLFIFLLYLRLLHK